MRLFRLLTAAVMLVCAVPAAAHPPPLGLLAHPPPVSYPDQLHPIDVVAMSAEPSPAVDPCPWPMDDRERTLCWVEHAFPQQEWESAMGVAKWESRYNPDAYNKKGCGGGGNATGLFQHCSAYWTERTARAFPDDTLDIWNGWHSTLMAAWLVEVDGWWHFHSCLSGQRSFNRWAEKQNSPKWDAWLAKYGHTGGWVKSC